KFNLLHTVIINLVLWVVSLVPAFISVWEVEERKHAGAVESAETEGKAEPASKVGVDEEVSKV
ncbi:hypothetical protein MCOR20_010496, partial [Pyricularia oryzae]